MKLKQILDLGSGRTSGRDERESGQEDGRLLRRAAWRRTEQGHRAGHIDSPVNGRGKPEPCFDPELAVCLPAPGSQLPGAVPALIARGDQAVGPGPADGDVISAVQRLRDMGRLRGDIPETQAAVAPGDGDVDLAGAGPASAYERPGRPAFALGGGSPVSVASGSSALDVPDPYHALFLFLGHRGKHDRLARLDRADRQREDRTRWPRSGRRRRGFERVLKTSICPWSSFICSGIKVSGT